MPTQLDTPEAIDDVKEYASSLWGSILARDAGRERDQFIIEVAANYRVSPKTLIRLGEGRPTTAAD